MVRKDFGLVLLGINATTNNIIGAFNRGERWKEGASYLVAFKNAYAKVGVNIKEYSGQEGAGKYFAIPLYTSYVVVFTAIPFYPVLETIEEARKLKEPMTEVKELTIDDIEEYLMPLEDCQSAPIELMRMLARKEYAERLKTLVNYSPTTVDPEE